MEPTIIGIVILGSLIPVASILALKLLILSVDVKEKNTMPSIFIEKKHRNHRYGYRMRDSFYSVFEE